MNMFPKLFLVNYSNTVAMTM